MRISTLLLLVLALGSLQGCFPVVAAGTGTGVLMANDRRTSGAYVEDEVIENKILKRISEQYGDKGHVNVTSFNRNVLLSGEVPDEAAKIGIGKLAAGTENVRNVNNELAVSGLSSLTSRGNDALITSSIKVRFMNNDRFNSIHVKVVTENGKVFLMGIVTHAEAAAAAELASTTKGVQHVVKLFEYIN